MKSLWRQTDIIYTEEWKRRRNRKGRMMKNGIMKTRTKDKGGKVWNWKQEGRRRKKRKIFMAKGNNYIL